MKSVSINTIVKLSFTADLELFLQTFSRFFLSRLIFDAIFYMIYIFTVDAFSFNEEILFNCSEGLPISVF